MKYYVDLVHDFDHNIDEFVVSRKRRPNYHPYTEIVCYCCDGFAEKIAAALNAMEDLQTANSESAPLVCECGDHITGDYAFVDGKYLCPVCME